MYALLVFAVFGVAGTPGQERPTLTGVVQSDAGQPLTGATVFISTAAPRKGVGVL